MRRSDLQNRLSELVATYLEIQTTYKFLTRKFGLTEISLWILHLLRTSEEETITQKTLCDLLYLPKQSVNSSLNLLREGGYVELVPGGDRRTKVIRLNKEGVGFARRTSDRATAMQLDAASKMTEEELEALIRLNREYAALLQESFDRLPENV